MSKLITINFFLFIVITSYLLGCKKNPFDKRSKYIGSYMFTIRKKTIYGISPITTIDTTFTVNGEITMNNSKNKINISFGATLLQANLYEDGTLIGHENDGKGEFLSTNEITYSYGGSNSGGSTNNIITGEKK